MKKIYTLIICLVGMMCLSSCGSANRGVRHGGLFYKGQVVKSNGERKTKTFILGKNACIRKNKRMQKRRARASAWGRNPNYGITTMGGARQKH